MLLLLLPSRPAVRRYESAYAIQGNNAAMSEGTLIYGLTNPMPPLGSGGISGGISGGHRHATTMPKHGPPTTTATTTYYYYCS